VVEALFRYFFLIFVDVNYRLRFAQSLAPFGLPLGPSWTLKSSQDPSQMPQDHPKKLQEGLKIGEDIKFCSKTLCLKKYCKTQGKTTIFTPPASSKSLQDGLKHGQDAPGSPQDGPKTSPRRS